MKKLKEEISLNGKIEKITMMDFRSSPGEILTQVDLGKIFIVCRYEKPIAVLSKVPGVKLTIVVGKKGDISYDA